MLELLAPARNLQCGIAAIDHGADAVYIGAQRFGARAAAGNSVDDIGELSRYAHQFGAKVFVTVNTILYDEELEDTEQLIWQLYHAGVDALLVQDMSVLQMNLPPIALHASTQTDNRTAEKVRWLQQQGFRRTVLARELSIEEITDIHKAVPEMPLEVFVHGALCVSYSGQCYASEHCFGRSANRGECAQFCRLAFDLKDGDGRLIEKGRHLLSLRDMRQLDNLEELILAGAVSFKIEGRLKDVDYVKNVVAAYSERLNEVIEKLNRKQGKEVYRRQSFGRCTYSFTPNLNKSFNRGFTEYFAHGRKPIDEGGAEIVSFDTPKSMGEYVGRVKEIRGNSFNVAGTASFSNGDGLCFLDSQRQLVGFRINRAEGNRLFPLQMPRQLKSGTMLFRNLDQCFTTLLQKPSAQRRLGIELSIRDNVVAATDEAGRHAEVMLDCELQKAEKPQRDNIVRQLSKLGNTIFEATAVDVPDSYQWFIPSSILAQARRELLDRIKSNAIGSNDDATLNSATTVSGGKEHMCFPATRTYNSYNYLYNASNSVSRAFYGKMGINAASMERGTQVTNSRRVLMQCRYCLRHAMGACLKTRNGSALKEPLTLSLPDGRTFELQFDCKNCQMNVFA